MNKIKMLKQAQIEAYELLIPEIDRLITDHIEDYYEGYGYMDFSREVYKFIDAEHKANNKYIIYTILEPVKENIRYAIEKILEERCHS